MGKLNQKFKQIFDKLDETIIIIDKKNFKISYVNDYFYSSFKNVLIEIPNLDDPFEKHSCFMEMKTLLKYKSNDEELISLKEAMTYDKSELTNMVFIFPEKYSQTDNLYFTIKINQLMDENEVMVSIIDVSNEVLRNNEKAH